MCIISNEQTLHDIDLVMAHPSPTVVFLFILEGACRKLLTGIRRLCRNYKKSWEKEWWAQDLSAAGMTRGWCKWGQEKRSTSVQPYLFGVDEDFVKLPLLCEHGDDFGRGPGLDVDLQSKVVVHSLQRWKQRKQVDIRAYEIYKWPYVAMNGYRYRSIYMWL